MPDTKWSIKNKDKDKDKDKNTVITFSDPFLDRSQEGNPDTLNLQAQMQSPVKARTVLISGVSYWLPLPTLCIPNSLLVSVSELNNEFQDTPAKLQVRQLAGYIQQMLRHTARVNAEIEKLYNAEGDVQDNRNTLQHLIDRSVSGFEAILAQSIATSTEKLQHLLEIPRSRLIDKKMEGLLVLLVRAGLLHKGEGVEDKDLPRALWTIPYSVRSALGYQLPEYFTEEQLLTQRVGQRALDTLETFFIVAKKLKAVELTLIPVGAPVDTVGESNHLRPVATKTADPHFFNVGEDLTEDKELKSITTGSVTIASI